MYVPEGPINFDVSWNSIIDSGLCPQMELRVGTQNPVRDAESKALSFKFTGDFITQEEAERILIQRFYKSEQINWVPPEQALEIAQAQQKPLHVISIDGPLADEAC